MRFILLIFFLIFSLNSCKEKETCFEKGDELVIRKCIDKILETREGQEIKDCYLVSPYLDTLSLVPYSEDEKKSLFEALDMSEKGFYKAQKEILKCGDNYFDSLVSLSNCDTSYDVFKVNKVYENLVQVRFTDYYEQVGMQQLKDNVEFKPNQMYEYVCVLKKDGEVDIILTTASFYD